MKRDKTKTKTPMTLHLWLYFVSFAVIILLALWLLQVVFLNAFYEDMKRDEVEKIGNNIVKLYNSNNGEFDEYWHRHSFRGGVFATILTGDGELVMSPEFMEEFKERKDKTPMPSHKAEVPPMMKDFSPETWKGFVDRVSKAKNGAVTYVINARSNSRSVVYGAKLKTKDGEERYLYLHSPLYPIDTTREILQKQLIIVSIISLLLSLILAYYIARRFSRPIIKASKTAEKLAQGKYDVSFEEGSYHEMSRLATVLNTAARQLGKTESLRRDLMANVSHDLKTPLTIIRSYAEMIRDISGDDKNKRDIHTGVIIDESNRLSLLVNDILNLSKLQAGISTCEKTEFSLSDAVNSVAEKFRVFMKSENYNLVLETEENIMAFGDEGQILQVIYNLVGNAVNYTAASGDVHIKLYGKDGFARFEVKDSGEGISKEELPFVWDRYYRTGKAHQREFSGSGIGLSIVKQILDLHKAKYGVESEEGDGTMFWFELPSPKSV